MSFKLSFCPDKPVTTTCTRIYGAFKCTIILKASVLWAKASKEWVMQPKPKAPTTSKLNVASPRPPLIDKRRPRPSLPRQIANILLPRRSSPSLPRQMMNDFP
ncbi:uncharacterized protein LACBIDRAFT_329998 [Laccaria bicolor S238N-H82]|uniref:Predicted protein n=1 Tax=Laccaria bicolor (strain S238N-H82 / ATCC MYA-4686) TaxID=486041 RepID=B0DJV7_LACBS|nr:uncharacterized protein LACBIDRAFT_329998 [Laccaria bicolor S238N-H82]EDR05275.1 predicted protein [Laccaria bicolor S238N-H82]|eukprot:XP_001884240.1 predicted protein [Laccaria bicolor S238N-H82]